MIDRFSGEYRFLSNFFPAKIVLDGQEYTTLEAAYQAAKTPDMHLRQKIRFAMKPDGSPWPGRAKRLGRSVPLRPGWQDMKLKVMEELLRQKFSHPELRERLAATGNEELIEGNDWRDTYWGVSNGQGENHLGKLLMKIRDEIEGE